MKSKALPERQLQIMQVLWGSSKAMTAAEIVAATGLNINTVQASLRSLTQKEYIKQSDIVYSGTVLARTYLPVVSMEEYIKMACEGLRNMDPRILLATVMQTASIEVLDELEQMILKRKKELEEEKQNDRK